MKYYLLSFFFCATCLNMMANDGRFIMYENSASSNGESSVSFQDTDLDEGISVISIIKDGKIIDTRKIMQ